MMNFLMSIVPSPTRCSCRQVGACPLWVWAAYPGCLLTHSSARCESWGVGVTEARGSVMRLPLVNLNAVRGEPRVETWRHQCQSRCDVPACRLGSALAGPSACLGHTYLLAVYIPAGHKCPKFQKR